MESDIDKLNKEEQYLKQHKCFESKRRYANIFAKSLHTKLFYINPKINIQFNGYFIPCGPSRADQSIWSPYWMKSLFASSLPHNVTLTHLFPMHPFSTPFSTHLTVFWCFQGVENGCIGNNWVKLDVTDFKVKRAISEKRRPWIQILLNENFKQSSPLKLF